MFEQRRHEEHGAATSIDIVERAIGGMLGLAAGDAVGTTLEFEVRGNFIPIDDMRGGGPFNLTAGQWTDDMSMAFCLGESLVQCRGFNPTDQMDRYLRWYREGYLSSTGKCFDIGNTVRESLLRYERTGEPFAGSTDPSCAGNGSLMRLLPVILFYNQSLSDIQKYTALSSKTTHGAEECVEACTVFGEFLHRSLCGQKKDEILFGGLPPLAHTPQIAEIARGAYRGKSYDQIRGTGYVVHTLEAALYCFHSTENFRDAVLKAANLGHDADTTAAVCGQIAGTYYGVRGIPQEWKEKLAMGTEIVSLAEKLIAGPS